MPSPLRKIRKVDVGKVRGRGCPEARKDERVAGGLDRYPKRNVGIFHKGGGSSVGSPSAAQYPSKASPRRRLSVSSFKTIKSTFVIPVSRKSRLLSRSFAGIAAIALLTASLNASAYEDDSDDYEGGRERAGVMSDYLTPESEMVRDQSFNGYYDEEGEDNEENGMVEFISPDAEDIEDVREDYPEEDWG